MAVSREIIDKVVNNADIVAIISSYITLEKKGSDYKGVCPFHNDTDPSLSVSPTKKVFKCFSCGTAGNAITFVQKFKHISFYEALKEVAETVGIKIDDGPVDERKIVMDRLYNVMEDASKFYKFYLRNTKEGVPAIQYLNNRQINDEIIEKFNIGLAPTENSLLFNALTADNKYLPSDIIQTGLVKENKGYYEIFRNRIMFPITNLQGKVVAFSGRLYNRQKDDNNPKYVNSSDTIIFKKGLILYNYYEAMNYIKNNDCCYIFEGFMDVIASYRCGVYNCVATMGTAMTTNQIEAIAKLTRNIVLCYDGDMPGINATKKAIHLLATAQMNVKIVTLPEGIDPDEYINQYGAEALKKQLLENASSSVDYIYNLEKRNLIIEDYNSIESYKKNIFSSINYFDSNVIKEIIFQKMANDLGVPIEVIKNDYTSMRGIEAPIYTNHTSNNVLAPEFPSGITTGNQIVIPVNTGNEDEIQSPEMKRSFQRACIAQKDLIKLACENKQICNKIDYDLNSNYASKQLRNIFFCISEFYRSNDTMDVDKLKLLMSLEDYEVLLGILNNSRMPKVSEIEELSQYVLSVNELKMVQNIYNDKRDIRIEDLNLAVSSKKKTVKMKSKNNDKEKN